MNNNTPGILISSTVTQVLKPTIVNEMNFGYTHNRWGFRAGPEDCGGIRFRLHETVRCDSRDHRAAAAAVWRRTVIPPALAGFGGTAD